MTRTATTAQCVQTIRLGAPTPKPAVNQPQVDTRNTTPVHSALEMSAPPLAKVTALVARRGRRRCPRSADVFRVRGTADIHREWIDALLLDEPHRDLMDLASHDCSRRTKRLFRDHTPRTGQAPRPFSCHLRKICDLIVIRTLRAPRRPVSHRQPAVDDGNPLGSLISFDQRSTGESQRTAGV